MGLCHGHQVRALGTDAKGPSACVTAADASVHWAQIVPWGSNDALALVQRKLDVDILVSGHSHEFKVGCRRLISRSAVAAYWQRRSLTVLLVRHRAGLQV